MGNIAYLERSVPLLLLPEKDPGSSASALESYTQTGPPTSLVSSLPREGCWDTGAPSDLGFFFAELAAHRDLVQGAVWSQDGALVGTTCKVSRQVVRLK